MYRVEDVADYYLSKEAMTPKKLQKILYYAYSWFLTLQNESSDELDNKLFEERFEAWVHGPVIPSIYYDYKHYGYQEIEQFDGELLLFNDDTTDILEEVWEVYGHLNGNQLESITHQEVPWINAREGFSLLERCQNELKDRDIFECYVTRLDT